jgi:hypothetical protein
MFVLNCNSAYFLPRGRCIPRADANRLWAPDPRPLLIQRQGDADQEGP